MTMTAIIKSLIVTKHEDGIEYIEMNNISSLIEEFEMIEFIVAESLNNLDLGIYEITLNTNGNEVICVKSINLS